MEKRLEQIGKVFQEKDFCDYPDCQGEGSGTTSRSTMVVRVLQEYN